MDVNTFAPGLSFFFDSHVDFFEEIAKFRAARRIWARWLRERYGATSERALWLRFHTQTAGVSLTAQQPVNNVVRTAIEALAAVLGGTNSLHTNALDETLALPTDESAEIALRTQQVIMEESGVVNVADPLGGSWYVEALTDRIEAEAEAHLRAHPGHGRRPGRAHAIGPMTGGILRGIEDGWFTAEIAESAFVYQQALEKGTKRIVGVNAHTSTTARELEILRISHEVELAAAGGAAPAAGRPGRRRGPGRPGPDGRRGEDRREPHRAHAGPRPGPRRHSARSATRCAPSGASTASPPGSETLALAFARAGLGRSTRRLPSSLAPSSLDSSVQTAPPEAGCREL